VSGLHSGDTSIGDIELNVPAFRIPGLFSLVISVALLELFMFVEELSSY
jgi:hypothetical protein